MFQNDTITFLTNISTNTLGSIKDTWLESTSIVCDVQEISKEKALKDYGFTDSNKYLQVFDLTLSELWVEGEQVKYDGEYYLVRKVIETNQKIGRSNHVFAVLSRVV
jgi:hypothetical protein